MKTLLLTERDVKELLSMGEVMKAVEIAFREKGLGHVQMRARANDWVTSGMHFNCIGADAPGKQELDPAILRRAKIFVDDWEQASHSGEINVPLAKGIITRQNVLAEIGEVVARAP